MCRALYKHPGRATPVTKDLLSKQRKNSRRIRNQLSSPGLHDLVRTPESQKPGVLIPSPAICSFSRPATFGRSDAYRVATALKIIACASVFLTMGNFTDRHTPSELGCPEGQCLLLALRQLGGCSDSGWKVTFRAEMPHKQRDWRRAQLLRNPAVETPSHLATQSQKTLCLKDLRLTIASYVFVSC